VYAHARVCTCWHVHQYPTEGLENVFEEERMIRMVDFSRECRVKLAQYVCINIPIHVVYPFSTPSTRLGGGGVAGKHTTTGT
jgi:hypothetical protein